MAVTLSAEAQTVFFSKVFGPTHAVTNTVKALLNAGVTFEVSLYALRAYVGTKALEPVQLTYGTTALMKGTAELAIAVHNKKLIGDWVAYLHAKQGSPALTASLKTPTKSVPPQMYTSLSVVLTGLQEGTKLLPVIKVVHQLLGKTLLEAKQVVEQAKAGTPVVVGTYSTYVAAVGVSTVIEAAGGVSFVQSESGEKLTLPTMPVIPSLSTAMAPKPVAEVIKLKHAAALGQKVHGTNPHSVYYTIAIGEHVKVAARLAGGSVSIRAEWTDNPTADLKKLEESGVGMKGDYASIHFDAAGVPIQRVVGAFLLGTGISWKQVVTNGAELVVGS